MISIKTVNSSCTVNKCSLPNSETIDISGRCYCWSKQGKKTRPEGVKHCKSLNAKLPLPKNPAEVRAFSEAFADYSFIYLDMTNPKKSGKFTI